MKRPFSGKSAGLTLMETMIGALISSILFLIGLFVYGGYSKMTRAEEAVTGGQQEFMNAQRLMERDVRMSGYALPGNGLYAQGWATPQFQLLLFRNENNSLTALAGDAQAGDARVLVANAHGGDPKQWICLSRDSTIAYYPIDHIGFDPALSGDTVWLKGATISSAWNHVGTQIRFAKGVCYVIDSSGGSKNLVRHCGEINVTVGFLIDSLSYIGENASGPIAGDNFSKAQRLQVVIGSHAKTAAQNCPAVKSFEVMIRNFL